MPHGCWQTLPAGSTTKTSLWSAYKKILKTNLNAVRESGFVATYAMSTNTTAKKL